MMMKMMMMMMMMMMMINIWSTGALFTKDEQETQLDAAFKYAVYQINRDEHILPDTNLMYEIDYISRYDSFHASKIGKQINILNSFSNQIESL